MSTIGGTTKGITETRSITGRSLGSRRWTQNTVGTSRMRLAATVSSAICTESQNELRKPGRRRLVRYQWNGLAPGRTLQAELHDRVDREEEEQGTDDGQHEVPDGRPVPGAAQPVRLPSARRGRLPEPLTRPSLEERYRS